MGSDNPSSEWTPSLLLNLFRPWQPDVRLPPPTHFGFWLPTLGRSSCVDKLLTPFELWCSLKAAFLRDTLISPLGLHMPHATTPCVDTSSPCLGSDTSHQAPLHGFLSCSESHIPHLQKSTFLCPTNGLGIKLFREEGERKRRKKMNNFKSFRDRDYILDIRLSLISSFVYSTNTYKHLHIPDILLGSIIWWW